MSNRGVRLGIGLADYQSSSNPALTTNLLAGLAWVQGASTTMTIAGGRVRATRAGGNPRVFKQVSGLSIGGTYKLTGNLYKGTQSGAMILRASETTEIPDGTLVSDTESRVINNDFIASAATMFIGMVIIADTDGQYAEISENLSLVRL